MIAPPRSPGRGLDLAGAALAAAQLGLAAVLVPRGDVVAWPDGSPLGVGCLSRALLHADCPMCGMTRSFVALAHGHLGAALGFHPAGPLLFVAMLVFVAAVVTTWVRQAPPLLARRSVLASLEIVALASAALGIIKMVRS
ncbi:MAG: DUF2752 domain-containing protein [Myxococcales bacterium]|nr:DUF2752 domain-containing protein [Myxococcales bacterium]